MGQLGGQGHGASKGALKESGVRFGAKRREGG